MLTFVFFYSGAQPDDSKSTTQSATDKLSREKDHQKSDDASMMDKAKHAVGLDKH